MKWLKILSIFTLMAFLEPSTAFASQGGATGAAAKIMTDHSQAAIGLFGNMRAPAALIGGSLVPLGIITALPITSTDSKIDKLLKRGTMIIAVASLLSEILAVTYSSIAINKLAEIPSPLTAGVAELIEQNHELAWVGTNIHFLAGLMGFALIAGSKAYSIYGNPVGKVAIGWSVAAFLQALSVVNKGIAMGSSNSIDGGGGVTSRFASNMFTLTLRYIVLIAKGAKSGGICSIGAIAVACIASFHTIKALLLNED